MGKNFSQSKVALKVHDRRQIVIVDEKHFKIGEAFEARQLFNASTGQAKLRACCALLQV